MSNFSKTAVIILLVLSFFFIKEKTGFEFHKPNLSGMPNFEFETNKNEGELVKAPSEVIKPEETASKTAVIYFLALNSGGNGIYKKVQRTVPKEENQFHFAVKELLKGPDIIEKTRGAYSEIPENTKLLGIKETDNKIVINLSSDFQNGGGTDSIYSRMMQLIKTAVGNSGGKKVYLQLDGKQIKFIGGEGIMITQPLSEKSPEI